MGFYSTSGVGYDAGIKSFCEKCIKLLVNVDFSITNNIGVCAKGDVFVFEVKGINYNTFNTPMFREVKDMLGDGFVDMYPNYTSDTGSDWTVMLSKRYVEFIKKL